MECVGYDNDFQLDLCEKFPLWKLSKGSGKSSPKKSQVAGLKRKREENLDFDSWSDDERKFEAKTGRRGNLSDDKDNVPTYTPQGTRSRPGFH